MFSFDVIKMPITSNSGDVQEIGEFVEREIVSVLRIISQWVEAASVERRVFWDIWCITFFGITSLYVYLECPGVSNNVINFSWKKTNPSI